MGYVEDGLRHQIRELQDELDELKEAGPPWLAQAAAALGETRPDGKALCLNWNQVLDGIRALRAEVATLRAELATLDMAISGMTESGDTPRKAATRRVSEALRKHAGEEG